MEETRTPHDLDTRTLDLVLPALAGLPDNALNHHLQRGNQKPVQMAIRKVLESKKLNGINWIHLEKILQGIPITFPLIVMPEGELDDDEPIRQMFPNGWYMICPAGVDLVLLHEASDQFNAKFHTLDKNDPLYDRGSPVWHLRNYVDWYNGKQDLQVQRVVTEMIEIFIPDRTDWIIPVSKDKNKREMIELIRQFGATLPEGWTCPVPSIEELTLTAFEYHRQTGDYPPNGEVDCVRCRNGCGDGDDCLMGGFDGPEKLWMVSSYRDFSGRDFLGGLRWAVRRGKLTTDQNKEV